MPLRAVPSSSNSSITTNQALSAPSAPGLRDTLRTKLSATSYSPSQDTTVPLESTAEPTSTHPLESRLSKWRQTQNALKMEGLRRAFGIAEPVRRGMELGIARNGEYRAGALGGSAGVSGDVLEGRDWGCDWEDVFQDGDTVQTPDFHTELEAEFKMNW